MKMELVHEIVVLRAYGTYRVRTRGPLRGQYTYSSTLLIGRKALLASTLCRRYSTVYSSSQRTYCSSVRASAMEVLYIILRATMRPDLGD